MHGVWLSDGARGCVAGGSGKLFCTSEGGSGAEGDSYFASFGALCLGDASACGEAGFFGYAGYGDTFGDGVPRNLAKCNVDPFCIGAGGFNVWNSPVAQISCDSTWGCMVGSYVFSQYTTGGAYTTDWAAQEQAEIDDAVKNFLKQAQAVADQLGVTLGDLLAAQGIDTTFLKGGNWNFVPPGDASVPSNCGSDGRCGFVPSLHIVEMNLPGGPQEFVHLDTANPFTGLFGAIVHGVVDGLLGNTVLAQGIPR